MLNGANRCEMFVWRGNVQQERKQRTHLVFDNDDSNKNYDMDNDNDNQSVICIRQTFKVFNFFIS